MMTIPAGGSALDYFPCRYGASRAVFRGPARDLSQPYVAMLGGSSTFGKYVARPYPSLVEMDLGRPVVNLGALNAGPDFYLADPPVLNVAARARVAVVELSGAEGVSNPFYTVHSRRNDRFLAATPALRALYPEVDLTDIHFTRHLLQVLHRTDPLRFASVVSGLQANWVARMRQLLLHLPPRRLLLWLADARPLDTALAPGKAGGPLFVDMAMVRALWPAISGLVLAMPGSADRAGGMDGKIFPEIEATQAALLPGPAQHGEVAMQLAPVLARLF